jgi:hypothetical protein
MRFFVYGVGKSQFHDFDWEGELVEKVYAGNLFPPVAFWGKP